MMQQKNVRSAPLVHTDPSDVLAPWIDPDLLEELAPPTPERALLLAMLENAVQDLLGGVTGASRYITGPVLRVVAHTWLHDRHRRDTFGSSAYVFAHLGIDQDWFLRKLAERRGFYRPCRVRR